jgi:hypothetical protein
MTETAREMGLGKPRRRPAGAGNEAVARAINAEPWEPLPGMVKRQCPRCRYFFAAVPSSEHPVCEDCGASRRPRRRPAG